MKSKRQLGHQASSRSCLNFITRIPTSVTIPDRADVKIKIINSIISAPAIEVLFSTFNRHIELSEFKQAMNVADHGLVLNQSTSSDVPRISWTSPSPPSVLNS